MLEQLWDWTKEHFTRKFTVPVHIAGGSIIAFLFIRNIPFAITLFVGFGVFEYWQGRKENDKGYLDFWDMLFGVFLGAIIILMAGL